MKCEISLIIPTYNEALNIANLLSELNKIREENKLDMELIIVDDSSADKTAEIAKQMVSKHDQVIVRSNAKGLSSAVVEALRQAKGDIIGVMDADLSHPPKVIMDLIRPILEKRVELTIGSRYAKGGGIKKWPLTRTIISKIACFLAKGLTPIKDATSGFFFVREEAIGGLNINPLGFKIGLEIFVRGRYKHCLEVPYVFINRKRGKSKLTFKPILEYAIQLKQLYSYRNKKRKNPIL